MEAFHYFFILFLSLTAGLLFFVAYNLNNKLSLLEDKMEEFAEKIEETYQKLLEVDKKGSFMSDDEVGFVFKEIKNLIKKLNDFYDENSEKEE